MDLQSMKWCISDATRSFLKQRDCTRKTKIAPRVVGSTLLSRVWFLYTRSWFSREAATFSWPLVFRSRIRAYTRKEYVRRQNLLNATISRHDRANVPRGNYTTRHCVSLVPCRVPFCHQRYANTLHGFLFFFFFFLANQRLLSFFILFFGRGQRGSQSATKLDHSGIGCFRGVFLTRGRFPCIGHHSGLGNSMRKNEDSGLGVSGSRRGQINGYSDKDGIEREREREWERDRQINR